MARKSKHFKLLLIFSTMISIGLMSFGISAAADSPQIVINETLKPGMALTEAMVLLGPPDTIEAVDTGTVMMPYDALGLSIEAMSGGTVIERIHIASTFKGKFSSGIGIGSDFQEIISAYGQPDMMTKEIIEYSGRAMVFQISRGKLVGADLYTGESALFHPTSSKKADTYVAEKAETYVPEKSEPYDAEKAEPRRKKEIERVEDEEDDAYEEEEKRDLSREELFDLYGFQVRMKKDKVVVTEVRPGSVAEEGGLKAGESIRKASYKGLGVRHIYTVGGLRSLLERAVNKRKKYVNILQDEHHYYKIRVPKRQ